MKVINPYYLIGTSSSEEISQGETVYQLLKSYKKLIEKNIKRDITIEDAFAAGYLLGTNSNLKQLFLDEIKEPKSDNRIQNQIL